MNKIYRVYDQKGKFLFDLSNLDSCKQAALKLYETDNLNILNGYVENDKYVINVQIVNNQENNTLLH